MPDTSLIHLLSCIGSKLQEKRHSRNEKISNVADTIHISDAVISKIENGRYKPVSLQMLSKLAAHYQMGMDELLAPPN